MKKRRVKKTSREQARKRHLSLQKVERACILRGYTFAGGMLQRHRFLILHGDITRKSVNMISCARKGREYVETFQGKSE
jgi:hypothetical protein